MYDLSSKFNMFYSSYVVLPQADQDELYRKKDLNVQRLKDGLKEYVNVILILYHIPVKK
jgi:hypothetical protein